MTPPEHRSLELGLSDGIEVGEQEALCLGAPKALVALDDVGELGVTLVLGTLCAQVGESR